MWRSLNPAATRLHKNLHRLENCVRIAFYRPFIKQFLYFNKELNHSLFQQPYYFPTGTTENKLICLSGIAHTNKFSALIVDSIPDLSFVSPNQSFPLYYYDESINESPSLFDDSNTSSYRRRDGISDFILERARKQYGKVVSKEDIFYYIYGILHSVEYKQVFANDLKKVLPRIPLVDNVQDFWAFSKAGRKLADLHLHYETVPPYPGAEIIGNDSGHYVVEKMRFPKKDKKDTIIFNSRITITNIPLEAFEYVVNAKSAIEWIMERYQVIAHKESGIINDPNDWAKEVGNPRYILDLLLSIINVSVQTVEIVNALPKLKFT